MSGHRLVLSRCVTERLLTRAGARAPWPVVTPPGGTHRLGPLPTDAAADPDLADPDLALARLGALVPDPADRAGPPLLHPRLVTALRPLREATVLVEIDLAVPAPGGSRRLHSWQWPGPATVAALSTTGGTVEVAWHSRADWSARCAEVPAAVPTLSPIGPPAPSEDPVLEAPAGLLLATGTALRAGRPDLAHALAPGSPIGLGLHECRARLRVLVTGATSARLLGWVLVGPGWRELTSEGRGVRFAPVRPRELGPRVERLVAGVSR